MGSYGFAKSCAQLRDIVLCVLEQATMTKSIHCACIRISQTRFCIVCSQGESLGMRLGSNSICVVDMHTFEFLFYSLTSRSCIIIRTDWHTFNI